MRKRAEGEAGASAVEFALVASLLFMILFGTIQFGIAFNRYQGLQASAREGARIASIGGTNGASGEIVTRVKATVSIIDTSSTAFPCPVSLSDQQFCVTVFYIDDDGDPVQTTSTATTPCAQASTQNSSKPEILVQAKYKLLIQIPFVGTMKPVITGEGRFQCET